MKTILSLFLVVVLSSCHGEYKNFDRGPIKEKFITWTKYGEPEYHFITDKHVYEVTPDEYAQHQVGQHYFESIYCIN